MGKEERPRQFFEVKAHASTSRNNYTDYSFAQPGLYANQTYEDYPRGRPRAQGVLLSNASKTRT